MVDVEMSNYIYIIYVRINYCITLNYLQKKEWILAYKYYSHAMLCFLDIQIPIILSKIKIHSACRIAINEE